MTTFFLEEFKQFGSVFGQTPIGGTPWEIQFLRLDGSQVVVGTEGVYFITGAPNHWNNGSACIKTNCLSLLPQQDFSVEMDVVVNPDGAYKPYEQGSFGISLGPAEMWFELPRSFSIERLELYDPYTYNHPIIANCFGHHQYRMEFDYKSTVTSVYMDGGHLASYLPYDSTISSKITMCLPERGNVYIKRIQIDVPPSLRQEFGFWTNTVNCLEGT